MNFKMKGQAALLLVALLAFTGCENDGVAPHDEAPVLGTPDIVHQAALVVMAATVVVPVILDPSSVTKDANEDILFNDPDGITGLIHLDYFLGGPSGEVSTSDVADYAHLFTDDEAPLGVKVDSNAMAYMGFNITADIDQEGRSAVVNGSGTFDWGPSEASFAFNSVTLSASNPYPNDGTVLFTSLLYEVTAFCDGTNYAIMAVTNGPTYRLNLDDGVVEEFDDVE
ncbi:MAG: hypothetical protein ACI9UK_000743 [Candidatus Krumholzibacteriia bacterium]|jgi:hypothetical protein